MIRKSLSIMVLSLWAMGSVAQTEGYDPINPPDPEVRLKHKLTTTAQPVRAGYVNYSDSRYRKDEVVYLYTSGYSGYTFKYWVDGDSVVSTSSSFYYNMPDRDVHMTAVYEYDPASPGQPYGMPGTLTLKASPKQAGHFNYSNNGKFTVGQELNIYAYSNQNYQFKHWEYRGEIVTNEYYYHFVMPEGSAELVAVFEYNPTSPGNPGTNQWNKQRGEVIIDDFSAGDLTSKIWEVTDYDYDELHSLIVAGKLDPYDIGAITEFPFTEIDLSRCSNATYIPSWTFEYNENLNTISLPSSIERMEWYAFCGCANLTTVNCYAEVPPALSDGVFSDIDKEQLVIYVPASSLDLYQTAEGWREFTIMPLRSQVVAMQLNLPEGAEDGRYKNMFIELVNTLSGQRVRYVITDRLSYIFQNLMHNTTWNAYVKNSADQVLGRIENIEVKAENIVLSFEELLEPQTITAKVLSPEGDDITQQVQLRWLDADGSYLGQSDKVSGILPFDGAKVILRVTLPQEMALRYQMPEDYEYEVQPTENNIVRQLSHLPSARITGRVCDILTEKSLVGATVTLSQTLNGRYGKSYTLKTDSEGKYAVDAFDAPTIVTAVAPEYISKSHTYEAVQIENGVATLETLGLKCINGATINVAFTYTLSAINGEQTETQPFFVDYQNVAYTIQDITTGQVIKDFNVQYPKIVLLEDVALGDSLLLTATSKTDAFEPVEAKGQVDANNTVSIIFDIKQLGQISAQFVSSENKTVNGILYDDKGKFVKSGTFENASLLFTELPDGRYTLIAMGSSKLFNTIYDLYKFSQAGLVKGTDYASATIQVKSGEISTVKVPYVPFFDESKLYYTGSNTSFAVNKAQVTAGSYLTLSSRVDFKSIYADQVSDMKLIVDLPEDCVLVDQSIIVGNVLGDYINDNNRITIPFAEIGDRIRFCIIPTAGGSYAPSAYVQFTYNNESVTQPIGQASFTVKDLSINVPTTIARATMPVNGTAVGKSKVQVYDNGILIGETTSLANGVWAATCQLDSPEAMSEHAIYAKVTTQAGLEMLSETKTVRYDPTSIQMEYVTMYYSNPEVNGWRGQNYELVYDFQNPSTTAYRYVYYIYNRVFTFIINLSQNSPESVARVILKVKTGDGKWHSLPATYDAKLDKWFVSSQFGNMYDGIVPVNVAVDFYVLHGAEEELISCPTSGYPDNDVPIDPSGYVYEGVTTNRVEGVTASCYYKETVEDQYGDKSEVIRLWDAAEYAQENPLFTDEDGFYRWDVPQGLWQVKFEKAGYETTYSEWLPVPPPQLDVNIAITQQTEPKVNSVKAYEDGVEIEFDKYMKSETLNTDQIYVLADDVKVEGSIELLNAEALDKDDAESPVLASKVKFALPKDQEWSFNNKLNLVVGTGVKSYADIALQQVYSQDLDVEKKVRNIVADSLLTVLYAGSRTLQVCAQPADAAKGKTLRIRTLSNQIADIEADGLENALDGSTFITLDENGQAELTVNGELPGSTTLLFSVDDTNAEGKTIVKVSQAPSLVSTTPRASRTTGSTVYRGTLINLLTDDDDADIWYTLDGSTPTKASIPFNKPIAINSYQVTIKAIAQKEGYEESEVATFDYSIKQSSQNLNLEGWSWISHGMNESLSVNELSDKVLEVKSLTEGVIRDEKLGLFGTLSKLTPTEAYKVKVSDNIIVPVNGDAFNASTGVISLVQGWNWIGYPVDQIMTTTEALANLTPSDGDIIVGQDASAEFIDGKWTGDLEVMTPGQGYMFKVSEPVDLLYNTAIVSKAAQQIRGRLQTQSSPWSVDIHRYPDVMPMRMQLLRDSQVTDANEFTVAAFAGTECRGIGKNVEGVIFMNVHGEVGEEISFMAYDNATENILNIDETLPFQTDNAGTFRAPLAIHLGAEADAIRSQYNKLGVWPTMATRTIVVSLGNRPIDRLTITSTDGKMLHISTSAATSQTVNISSLPAGVYIVAVQSGSECFYKKIVKVNQ